jgi:hypothetical protein
VKVRAEVSADASAKRCLGCGEMRPLADYYDNRNGLLGKQSRCKPCFVKQILATPGRAKKQRARNAVWYAIKKGTMVRPSECSACGAECVPEGHHDDYGKPLDVRWLCVPCHEAVHSGQPYARASA